jgi:betaine reductase
MIAKEIEKVGIPAVQITSVVDVGLMVGVSRLIRGFSITSPLADTRLDPEAEKEMRRRYVYKAIRMLQEEGNVGSYKTI